MILIVVFKKMKKRIAWWVTLGILVVFCAISSLATHLWLGELGRQLDALSPQIDSWLAEAYSAPHDNGLVSAHPISFCLTFVPTWSIRQGLFGMIASFGSLALFLGITLLREKKKHNKALESPSIRATEK